MREAKPALRHRLEFAAYRLFTAVLRRAPERWAVAFGSALGWLAGGALRIRRGVVEENLAGAFPDADPLWRRRVALESYRHLGREAVMTFRLAGAGAEEILARTRVEGMDELLRALERGRGVVVATGHMGNWEVAGAAVAARGAPVDAVVFRQRNRLFDEELVRNRQRLGMRVIPRARAPREVLRSLRAGRLAALLADQNAGRGGVFVDFLGRPASTARGPALFAVRTGAPLFAGACVADRGLPSRYTVYLEELALERSGDVDEDVRRLTEAHTAFLARFVRSAPEQYFWQHKRWKTRPPPSREAGAP